MVEYDTYFESHDHVVCLEMFSKSHSSDVGLLLMCMRVCVCVCVCVSSAVRMAVDCCNTFSAVAFIQEKALLQEITQF